MTCPVCSSSVLPLTLYFTLSMLYLLVSTDFPFPYLGLSMNMTSCPPSLNETLKLISYVDDLKPIVRTMSEISLCISECTQLELASGVQLHRDSRSGKVKILLLDNWKHKISQDDIPFPFIKISNFLDCVGVCLYKSFFLSKQANSSF